MYWTPNVHYPFCVQDIVVDLVNYIAGPMNLRF